MAPIQAVADLLKNLDENQSYRQSRRRWRSWNLTITHIANRSLHRKSHRIGSIATAMVSRLSKSTHSAKTSPKWVGAGRLAVMLSPSKIVRTERMRSLGRISVAPIVTLLRWTHRLSGMHRYRVLIQRIGWLVCRTICHAMTHPSASMVDTRHPTSLLRIRRSRRN